MTHKGRAKSALEKFLETPPPVLDSALSQLRHSLLIDPLPSLCPYRAYIWSVLLRCAPIGTEWYSGMVVKGPCGSSSKISNDIHRTFGGEDTFWGDNKEEKSSQLNRLLNVYGWMVHSSHEMSPYVQGMNVIAGVSMYVSRSEPQAFALFQSLLINQLPRYATPNLVGVNDGVNLVDIILKRIDTKLYSHLSNCMLSAKIYAFPLILTLSACTPTLDEVTRLWDFFFAYGVHLNVVAVVAQVLMIREQLLKSDTPMAILRQFPKIQADTIIKLSLGIVKKLDDDLYELVVRHTHDDVRERIEAYLP
ncbi:Bub2 protein [Martiniozyma asiatica (nom. inval.)]|nr:Bub2 protein [Martiniozyma asiatica]